MLILLYDRYVMIQHIVEVVAHPERREVCVILTTGHEILIEMGDFETKEEAVARVAHYIMSKVG